MSFAIWLRSDIGLYDVGLLGGLPGLMIGMMIDFFHCCGIMHVWSELLKSCVIFVIAIGPR